jgi:hypothetical protein
MVHTVLCVKRPHLSHTCPTRHLKVQNYEDTCDVACTTQKDNEFERQPRLPGQHLNYDWTIIFHFMFAGHSERSFRSLVTNLNYDWTIIFHFMFAGHSERVFRSSVTKVTEFIFLQTSHSPLTITVETRILTLDPTSSLPCHRPFTPSLLLPGSFFSTLCLNGTCHPTFDLHRFSYLFTLALRVPWVSLQVCPSSLPRSFVRSHKKRKK